MIRYGLNLSNEKITSNRGKFMRFLHNPTGGWVELSGNDYEDYINNFTIFDSRINRYSVKSFNKEYRDFINSKGLLFLYYKYHKNSETS